MGCQSEKCFTNKLFTILQAAIGFQYATEFKPVCPGYLISTRGVVTAASCLGKLSIDQMMVRLGWHGERSDPSTIRFEPVHSRNVHPLYNETTGAHNIAVIKLKNAIQPNVHLFPACLWSDRLESPVMQRILFDGEYDKKKFFILPCFARGEVLFCGPCFT